VTGVLKFLYGNRNITGSVLGLVGLGLFFAGLAPHFWYLIVPGLYGIGYLAAPGASRVDLSLGTELSQDAIASSLASLTATVKRRAEPDVYALVASIRDSIIALLPHAPDPNLYVVRQTALDYLPATLQGYLNLPPVFRRMHPVRDGKTAHALLLEQLTLLDAKMKEVLVSVHENDTQALLVNGRFLQERFGASTPFTLAP
jgi:hypothetical protein